MNTNNMNHIYKSMSNALSLDDMRRHREAYQKYLDVIESSVIFLRQVEQSSSFCTSTGSNHHHLQQQHPSSDQVAQLCKYTDECLKRVEYLYTHHIGPNQMQQQQQHGSSLSPSPPPPVQYHHNIPQQQQQQQISSPLLLTPNIVSSGNSFIVSGNNNSSQQQTPGGIAPRAFLPFKLFSSDSSNAKNLQIPSSSSSSSGRKHSSSLASARKMAEEMALQQMHEQMEYQKEMARRKHNLLQFERTLNSNSKRFKWRSQDTWSKFLDSNFNYLNMQADLLHEDSHWLMSLSEAIPELSDQQASDKIVKLFTDHFKVIVAKPGHAINTLLVNFSTTFLMKYDSKPLLSLRNEQQISAAKEMLAKAVTDVNTFVEKLVQALFGKYWTDTMNDVCERVPECERESTHCIIEQLMSGTGVYLRLLNLYSFIHREKDELLNDKFQKLNRGKLTLKHFDVRSKFRLGEDITSDSDPYSSAIDKLIEFDREKFVAGDKLRCLVDCIREITCCVNRYYESFPPTERPKDLDLGADDLLPLFCYVLSRAQPKSLFSKLNYLSDFAEEETFMGECGYGLATLETAMNYMLTFEVSETFFDNESPKKSPTVAETHTPQLITVPSSNTLSTDSTDYTTASLMTDLDYMSESLQEDDFADLF